PPGELDLLRYLISHIDDRGYLSTPLEEIARGLDGAGPDMDNTDGAASARESSRANTAVAIPVARLEQALARIQKLDPPGVGARDCTECLLLQVTAETRHR